MVDLPLPPFSPKCLYTGPWNPSRHDLVTSKVVTTDAEYRAALAEGWRHKPDREDDAAVEMVAHAELFKIEPAVSQEPKRRGPGRPKRDPLVE